jgi:AraC family transcriptional regulator of adaptative response/methylated-DNA-[protein]-cysteine methyltransferase
MPLFITSLSSPLGELTAVADETHLLLLEFGDSRELQRKIQSLEKRYEIRSADEMNAVLQKTKEQLEEYFRGTRKSFDIPLEVRGTEFQMKAWKALEAIPFGETRNYLEEATMIGSPKAVRAIWGANHHNPVVIIIPCHRVIGKSGKLVGYGWGIERKKWLLDHEKTSL